MVQSNRLIRPRVTYCFVRVALRRLADFVHRRPADQERKTAPRGRNRTESMHHLLADSEWPLLRMIYGMI